MRMEDVDWHDLELRKTDASLDNDADEWVRIASLKSFICYFMRRFICH